MSDWYAWRDRPHGDVWVRLARRRFISGDLADYPEPVRVRDLPPWFHVMGLLWKPLDTPSEKG